MSTHIERLTLAIDELADHRLPGDNPSEHELLAHVALSNLRIAEAIEKLTGELDGGMLFAFCDHGVAFCQLCLADRGAFRPAP